MLNYLKCLTFTSVDGSMGTLILEELEFDFEVEIEVNLEVNLGVTLEVDIGVAPIAQVAA